MRDVAATLLALESMQSGWAGGLVASLPRSVRMVPNGGTPDLVLIDGCGSWVTLAHKWLALGARKILVIEPRRENSVDVAALAHAVDAVGADLRLSETFPGNAAVASMREWMDPNYTEIVVNGFDSARPTEVLMKQLRVLRSIGLSHVALLQIRIVAAAYAAEGCAMLEGRNVQVRLTGAKCGAIPPQHEVIALSELQTARLVVYGGAEARPAEASLTTPSGKHQSPAIFQGAHRHALRAILQGAVLEGGSALRDYAEDAAISELAETPR